MVESSNKLGALIGFCRAVPQRVLWCCLPYLISSSTLFALALPLSTELETLPTLQILHSKRPILNRAGLPLISVGTRHEGSVLEYRVKRADWRVLFGGKSYLLASGNRIRISNIKRQTRHAPLPLWRLKALEIHRGDAGQKEGDFWRHKKLEPNLSWIQVGAVVSPYGNHIVDNRQEWLVSSKPFNAHTQKSANPQPDFYWLAPKKVSSLLHLTILDSKGKTQVDIQGNDALWLVPSKRGAICSLKGECFVTTTAFSSSGPNMIEETHIVSETQWLLGVLPSEIFINAPLAALKAQAVAARGELYAKLGHRHLDAPYMLCSKSHCQNFNQKHLNASSKGLQRLQVALEETQGQILVDPNGQLVPTFYSASCGGHGANAAEVWGRPPHPSLLGAIDTINETHRSSVSLAENASVRKFIDEAERAYCSNSGYAGAKSSFRWTKHYDTEALLKLSRRHSIGRIQKIQVVARGQGGRAKTLHVIHENGTLEIHRELAIRRWLGDAKSALFYIDSKYDALGELKSLKLIGAGFGHGAGMCQHGAIGRAQSGQDYDEILEHYFPESRLEGGPSN